MSSRLAELAQRRVQLVERSEAQRVELAIHYQRLKGPLVLTENGLRLARSLARSPLAVTGLALALMKTPWRKLAPLPRMAWRGWKIYRFVKEWVQ